MRAGFIKTRAGMSCDNKTISTQLGPIVSLFLVMLSFPFNSLKNLPCRLICTFSAPRFALSFRSWPDLFAYPRLKSPSIHPSPSASALSLSLSPHILARCFLFDRLLVNIHTSIARDLFVKSTHPSRRREKEKLKPSLLAYPSLWSLGVTANPRAFPGEARRFVHIRVRFAWKLFGS